MARRLTSFLLLLLATAALAQPFGRFGYSDTPTVPGMIVAKDGFVARFGASDKFYFSSPAEEWKVISTTDSEQQVQLKGADGPDRLRASLYSPGVQLRFPKGFSLKLRSTAAPYLSWREGSVGPGVPTPSSRWIIVSFQDQQPPVVLGFIDAPVSLQIQGKTGDWTISSAQPYKGEVRAALPLGTKPYATTSAAQLGELSEAASGFDAVWWQPIPQLVKFDVSDENTAVEATWTFDRPNVVIPAAAVLAPIGEYPLTIKSETRRLPGSSEEGPMTICTGTSFTLRLPVFRVPLGRAITIGGSGSEAIGTVSPFDFTGISELALENLLAGRDLQSKKNAEQAVASYIQEVSYAPEPHTAQKLPYAKDGSGLDLCAANSFLQQAFSMSVRATSSDNSLLTSLGWRRDWYSWRLWGAGQHTARRAGALAALAGAFCPEPLRRMEGAMYQAGLAAERGLGIFQAREAGKLDEPLYLEPLYEFRNTIFQMVQQPRHTTPFGFSVLGDLRIFGEARIRCSAAPDGELTLSWEASDAPNGITIASAFPLEFTTPPELDGRHFLGYTTFVPKAGVGSVCEVKLRLPQFGAAVPTYVPPLRYTESVN